MRSSPLSFSLSARRMLYIELSNTHPAAYNLTHVTSDAHTVFFRDFCLLQPSPVFLSRHVYFSVYFLNSNTPPTPDPRTRLVNTHTDTHGLHPYLRLLISTAVVFSFPTPLARSPPFVVFPPQIAFSLLLNSSQAHSSPSIFHTSRVSLISCSQHHILPHYSSLSLSLSLADVCRCPARTRRPPFTQSLQSSSCLRVRG